MSQPNSAVPETLILPIGHYVGARRTEDGVAFHLVRTGWDVHRLDDTDQLTVWTLAHGMPITGDLATWTRSMVEGTARLVGILNVTELLDDLLARELLVQITPGTPRAVEFAQVCRTRSLLNGLGNSADDPQLFGIGLVDAAPVVAVPSFAYDLWRWAHTCDSLWHACVILARSGQAVSPEDPDYTDPERVLGRCLSAIQLLLAHGVIYLDAAREPWDDDPSADVETEIEPLTTTNR